MAMNESGQYGALRPVLIATGLVFIFGIFALMRVWPSGFKWSPGQPEYEQMILGVYATLGVFLLIAARSPQDHRSLILFAAWSSLVHSAIMGVQAILDATERGHLLGDVPALAIIGVALWALAPKPQAAARAAGDAAAAGSAAPGG
jgi:hypothetical protein